MSQVEEYLRSQAESWREVSERVSMISNREFPSEPPKRLLIFGVGSSHFAARLAGYTLNRDKTRPRMSVVACSSVSIGSEVIPTRGDWAFAISHRGKTPATMAALEVCHRANAFTVVVTGKKAPISEFAQLQIETCEIETIEPHTVSMTSAVCAVSTHFLGSKVKEEWEALGSLGSPSLETVQRRVGKGPNVIVGEWEGQWIAREGALKMMEMARLPVRAFSTEEFLHGPQRSVRRPEDSVWTVCHPRDPRVNEIEADYRFQIHGSTPLAWVPALVELQWASLAVAVQLGIDPDAK